MEKSKGARTRHRVIEKTIELVHENGFNKTSMSDIIRATGVKKGNLYFHFSNKEQIGLEIIREAHKRYMAYLEQRMTSHSPLKRIEQLLYAVLEYHQSRQFVGGCIFGNIALEMSHLNSGFADLIKKVFTEWEDSIVRLIEAAKQEKEISPQIDPHDTARHIVASMEGSIMMAKLNRDEDYIHNCINAITVLLKKQ